MYAGGQVKENVRINTVNLYVSASIDIWGESWNYEAWLKKEDSPMRLKVLLKICYFFNFKSSSWVTFLEEACLFIQENHFTCIY